MLLLTIFTTAVRLSGPQHALLLLPLCLSVALVYKTIRCSRVRDIPVASIVLAVTIVAGMYAVGIAFFLAQF